MAPSFHHWIGVLQTMLARPAQDSTIVFSCIQLLYVPIRSYTFLLASFCFLLCRTFTVLPHFLWEQRPTSDAWCRPTLSQKQLQWLAGFMQFHDTVDKQIYWILFWILLVFLTASTQINWQCFRIEQWIVGESHGAPCRATGRARNCQAFDDVTQLGKNRQEHSQRNHIL